MDRERDTRFEAQHKPAEEVLVGWDKARTHAYRRRRSSSKHHLLK